MKYVQKFWWVLVIGVAVWWYKKRSVSASPVAFNGVPKYLDPASRGVTLPGTDFSQPLF